LLPLTADWNGFIETLRAANEDLIYVIPGFGGRAKAANEIAYADEAGEMQFLCRSLLAGAYKFDSRRSQVLPVSMLKHFRENLNFVTTLVCIGYGFGDFHINSILREWLEFIPERSLEIVNPSAKYVPAFLLHLLPQVTITPCNATDYLDKEAGIVRTRLERAEKRLANLVRSKRKTISGMLVAGWLNSTHQKLANGLSDALRSIPIV
jgi:hypothetical protein